MPKNAKAAALQQVSEFPASDRATEEKVDRLVTFLADELESNELLSQTQMEGPVAQEIADTKARQGELLKKLGGGGTLLQDGNAAAAEDVAAFLADTEQHHKDDKEHTKDDKVATELGRAPDARVEHVPKAITLEVATETLPSAIALSSQRESAMPHMMFGGAFLLVAAVLLTVMTKHARKPHASKDDANAYYYLHQ